MITKINSVKSDNNINFKKNSAITKSGYAILSGNAAYKTNSLKSVCKEILLRINNNKNLIAITTAALGGIKLTETAITIYSEDKKDGIRLSMPRGVQGNLFKMQVIKDEKPTNSVIVDHFNKLVKSYSLNQEHFLKEKDVDQNLISATVEGIFDTVDEPLFQIRMYTLKNNSATKAPTEKIVLTELPKIEEIKKQKEQEALEAKKNKKIIPTAEQMKNFSMRELIKQQHEEPVRKPTRERKYKRSSLIPVSKLSPEERAKLKPATNTERPSITVYKEAQIENLVVDSHAGAVKVNEKRRRGRPAKVKSESTDTATRTKKQSKVKLPAGIINPEVKTKIDEILSLNSQISDFFKKISVAIGVKIRTAYEGFKSNKGKMSFGDLTISLPKRKNYAGHNILNITDSTNNTSLNISDSENIISSKINWNSNGLLPKLKFFSQPEVEEKLADENYSNLIDNALINLRNFKAFLDNKGWQKAKQKDITVEQSGSISDFSSAKIQNLTETYNDIQAFIKSLPQNRSLEVRKNYGQVAIIRNSSRLEFINPLGDGSNVIFNKSKSKFGNFTFIIKHDGNKNIEEAFVISKEGKILKNIRQNSGVTEILPANPNQKLKFYSQEEIEQNKIQNRLDNLLNLLESKMTEYQQYLENYEFAPKMTKKVKPKIKEQEILSLSSVRDFISNFVNNLQEKAMNFTMMTGYKSSLDSVAKDLKAKFEEFLNKQGK